MLGAGVLVRFIAALDQIYVGNTTCSKSQGEHESREVFITLHHSLIPKIQTVPEILLKQLSSRMNGDELLPLRGPSPICGGDPEAELRQPCTIVTLHIPIRVRVHQHHLKQNTHPRSRQSHWRIAHEEFLAMKRFAAGLPKPCSPIRRKGLIEDVANGNTFPPRTIHQSQFLGTRHNVRHASSKLSRPRTALFFPGNFPSYLYH